MKSTIKTALIFSALSILVFSCKESDNQSDLTQADIDFAAQVMTASLVGESDGFMASMYDATANVDKNGITYGSNVQKSSGGNERGRDRGVNKNFQYSYDPTTGTHTLSLERSLENPFMTKNLSILIKRIVKHESGAFVRFPKANRDSINSIYYTSTKQGSELSARREGNFLRVDTLSMSGLDSVSTFLAINGKHNGSGSMKMTNREGVVMERTHQVSLKLTDVQIKKATVRANQNLEEGITGIIDYRIVSYNSKKDDGEKVVEGTIEMTGDGTALMKFKRFTKRVLINLYDGSSEMKDK